MEQIKFVPLKKLIEFKKNRSGNVVTSTLDETVLGEISGEVGRGGLQEFE